MLSIFEVIALKTIARKLCSQFSKICNTFKDHNGKNWIHLFLSKWGWGKKMQMNYKTSKKQ